MILLKGVSIVLTKGYVISGFPSAILFIGNGDILGIPMPMILFILGAALMAGVGVGLHPSLAGAADVARKVRRTNRVLPNEGVAHRYELLYSRYRDLYESTRHLMQVF